jgi:hypothetical protein
MESSPSFSSSSTNPLFIRLIVAGPPKIIPVASSTSDAPKQILCYASSAVKIPPKPMIGYLPFVNL